MPFALTIPVPGLNPLVALQAGSLLGELVFGYLQHHGHWETAAAVGRDVLGGAVSVSQADVADARRCGCSRVLPSHVQLCAYTVQHR